MTAEENKRLVRRSFEELWNTGNLDAMGEYFADDVVDHPVAPGASSGLAALRQGYEAFFASFPDAHLTLDDLLSEGDKVVARYTWSGTQRGPFLGLVATGKQVTGTRIAIYRIADGKIAERWHEWNPLALLQQLQAAPAQ
jgi:steroid delta-isomerase-like uncharacterized protein